MKTNYKHKIHFEGIDHFDILDSDYNGIIVQ